jgi:hypothetical protein
MRLTAACANYSNSIKTNRVNNGTSMCVKDFFRTFKKGSKSIRSVITSNSKQILLENLQSVKTYFNITGTTFTSNTQLGLLYTLWSCSNLPNRFREFCFKFSNNLLGINTRISHFVGNHSRACTFCTITKPVPPDETFLHLFYECDTVGAVHHKFYTKNFPEINGNEIEKRKLWFGLIPSNIRDKTLFICTIMLIQFGIWESKLKKNCRFSIVSKIW